MSTLPGIRSVYTSASKDYCRIITSIGSVFIEELDDGSVAITVKPHKTKQCLWLKEDNEVIIRRRPRSRVTTGLP